MEIVEVVEKVLLRRRGLRSSAILFALENFTGSLLLSPVSRLIISLSPDFFFSFSAETNMAVSVLQKWFLKESAYIVPYDSLRSLKT